MPGGSDGIRSGCSRRPATTASTDAFPGAAVLLPDQGRDGRLPRSLCGALQPAGPQRHPRRPCQPARQHLCRLPRATAGSRRTKWSSRCRATRPQRRRHSLGRSTPTSCSSIRAIIATPRSCPGAVLIVGAANSGAEIAKELVRRGRRVVMAGSDPAEVPFRPEGFFARHVLLRILFRIVFHRRADREHAARPESASGAVAARSR